MDFLSGFAIFLLGASTGSLLRYFQDRKLLEMYRHEAQQSAQALLELVSAFEGHSSKKAVAPAPPPDPTVRVSRGSLRSA